MKLTIDIPDEIIELAERLRTQDNACTENPAFEVQEWEGIAGWRTVQTFLTAAAAEQFLASNRHNLRPIARDAKVKPKQPRVYAAGGYRNHERTALRTFLMSLASTTESEATDSPEEQLFYIQDSRTFVGNGVLWWGPRGGGYTAHVDQAGKYTLAAARSRTSRDTDVLWPCAAVDAIWSNHVDMQALGRLPTKGVRCSDRALDALVAAKGGAT